MPFDTKTMAVQFAISPRAVSPWQVPLLYYSFYGICALFNTLIVPTATISLEAGSIALLFVGLIAASAWIAHPGRPTPTHSVSRREELLLSWVFRIIPPLVAVLIAIKWVLLIQRYGSLSRIFAHAFAVRMESIGNDGPLIEAIGGYGISLIFVVLTLAMSSWVSQPDWQSLRRSVLCVLLIFFNDLTTFARMGTLWAMLTCLSTIILFRVESHISRKRIVVIACLGFVVMSLPRMVRHGLLSGGPAGVSGEDGRTTILRSALDGATASFVDYSSGLSAFSTFIYRDEETTSGRRTFTPLWRITQRVGLADSGKYISTIDEPADNVAADYNLYTVLRDFYQDFGIIGVCSGAIVFGIAYGASFFNLGLLGKALSIYMTAWLLYTPFYNAFSFGAFLIPFAVMVTTQLLMRFKDMMCWSLTEL